MSPIGCHYPNHQRRMNVKSLEITNEQLMKAIECCLIVDCDTCDYCPLYDRDNGCTEDGTYTLLERAFDLIKRLQTEIDILIRKKDTLREENAEQQAEIERKDKILNSYALQYGTVTDQSKKIQEIRTEAIKEFAEFIIREFPEAEYFISGLVKEMTEGNDGK